MRHDKHRNTSGKLHNNHDDEQFVMLQEVSSNLQQTACNLCLSEYLQPGAEESARGGTPR
jgi:hypothetical protein